MQRPAGLVYCQQESIYPHLQHDQLHYEPHWSLCEVLTGGKVAWSSPISIETKSGDKTGS